MAKSLRTTSGKASSASRSKHRRTRSLSGVPSSTVGATSAEGDACGRACRGVRLRFHAALTRGVWLLFHMAPDR